MDEYNSDYAFGQQITSLARSALESWVLHNRKIFPPDNPDPRLASPGACFVCIKAFGVLRGCIGTIEPVTPTLAEEIIRNAIACGTHDPRFLPVAPHELPELRYTVDILGPMQPVESLEDHDPKNHGLMVESRGRRGLLLPDITGVDTPAQQLEICLSKAGIQSASEVEQFYRFGIQRFSEDTET